MWMALALIMSFEKENGIDLGLHQNYARRQTIGRPVLSSSVQARNNDSSGKSSGPG
jgi:hypothetical protein